ncbi:MAG TPA: alpha/beta hydrolase [Clostridia bacterium]|nr:alpha/beta hydrolase [Clostridia bacterium]
MNEDRARNQELTLSDGRKLGYADYGDPQAQPVLYFHGWPGSRLEPLALAHTANPVRIIAVDRPGYGLSTFKPKRSIVQWPADIRELAAHLKLDRFYVLGLSGGGPYALACAAFMPGHIAGVRLACSMGETDVPGATERMTGHNRQMLALVRTAPKLTRFLARIVLWIWRKGNAFLPPGLVARLPRSDQRCLADPHVHAMLVQNWREALRPGTAGMVWDGSLYAEPWGFSLAEVRVPVRLWHGLADIIVPPEMGERLAKSLPQCQAFYLSGEGHFSLPLNHMSQILSEL